jgi:hypothetical protein
MAVIDITSTAELTSEASERGIAWLLTGETIGAIDVVAWDPVMRRKP